MVVCGCVLTLMLTVAVATAPPAAREAIAPLAALVAATLGLATWFYTRGFSRRLFVIAGLVLMVFGIVVAATLPDGLDGAVILPLTGALLVLPVLRGRALLAMFVLAFAASMVGEVVAHMDLAISEAPGPVSLPVSIAASAMMLAFAYGLVWWVSNQWLSANERSTRTLASQRQLLVLNERFLATVDPQQVLSLLADSLKSLVDYDNLTIYRVDRGAGLLRPVLARDRFASLILESTIALDRGITGWVATHGEAQCVNDASHDPRMALIPGTPAEDESLIIVPLIGEGSVLGTLNLGRMGGPEAYFSTMEFEIARLFASQASIALLNAESHRAVATRAETDALTGLRNRRAFDEGLASLSVDPGARPIVLVMLDLDGFKQFNDRFGHPAGDMLLNAVAGAMNASVRGDDRVYRLGGDEFAVLLPMTGRRVGMQVARRIRTAIAGLDSGGGAPVAASIGVATCPDDVADPSVLVRAADAALYRAKHAGGNRVDSAERLVV